MTYTRQRKFEQSNQMDLSVPSITSIRKELWRERTGLLKSLST